MFCDAYHTFIIDVDNNAWGLGYNKEGIFNECVYSIMCRLVKLKRFENKCIE